MRRSASSESVGSIILFVRLMFPYCLWFRLGMFIGGSADLLSTQSGLRLKGNRCDRLVLKPDRPGHSRPSAARAALVLYPDESISGNPQRFVPHIVGFYSQ